MNSLLKWKLTTYKHGLTIVHLCDDKYFLNSWIFDCKFSQRENVHLCARCSCQKLVIQSQFEKVKNSPRTDKVFGKWISVTNYDKVMNFRQQWRMRSFFYSQLWSASATCGVWSMYVRTCLRTYPPTNPQNEVGTWYVLTLRTHQTLLNNK